MPEGHVTHRAARLHGKRFVGQRVRVTSPQGRFSESAERVDGKTVRAVTARGKHLFYLFSSGDAIHIHLGLVGKFRLSRRPFPEASPNARVLIWTEDHEMQLTGPNTCELLTDADIDRVVANVGPDPIADGRRGKTRFAELLRKRSIPIGRAFLDQKVVAGVGNVFRSELLFLAGIPPMVRSKDVTEQQASKLWDHTVRALKAGERAGRIVTVSQEDAGGESPAKLDNSEALYVYHREGQPCRRCRTPIRSHKIDSRFIWWCPACQQ